MASSVKTWIRKQKSIIKNMTMGELSSSYCFRDPLRPIKNNPEIIYSPADGVLIDISHINNINVNIYTKYGHITLEDLSHGMIPNNRYDVITIFLTFYDPHIIRMPVDGIVNRTELPAYYVENRPMLDFENEIMDIKFTSIRKDLVNTFAFNQRTLYRIKNPFFKDEMYLLLTADYDIDTILGFNCAKFESLKQGERLASIRYGSMVTCVVPETWKAEIACKENTHIEAGNDFLFYI